MIENDWYKFFFVWKKNFMDDSGIVIIALGMMLMGGGASKDLQYLTKKKCIALRVSQLLPYCYWPGVSIRNF
jgi:hypothetical protein